MKWTWVSAAGVAAARSATAGAAVAMILAAGVPDLSAQESATSNAGQSVASVAWLAGCWRVGEGDSFAEEQWTSAEGGAMVGLSKTVRAGRVRAYEFLLIRPTEEGFAYWAYPSGQSPTTFPAVSSSADEVVFANPEHDFPQKIRYRRLGDDRVVASVFGEVDGTEPAFEIDYIRATCPGG